MVVPLLILFIPFLDVVLAVVRRTWRGEGIGHADKEHLHHRLLDVGHTQRSAVLLMYLWSALISGSALAVGLINGRLAVGIIVLASGLLILATALPRLRRRGPERRGVGLTGSSRLPLSVPYKWVDYDSPNPRGSRSRFVGGYLAAVGPHHTRPGRSRRRG